MVKQGIVKEVKEIKTGLGRGNKMWTLWKVFLEDGFEATTFDNIYSPGQKVDLSVEKQTNEGKNGVKYENYRIVPGRPQKEATNVQNKKFEELMSAINDLVAIVVGIDAKLDEIQNDLAKRP